MTINSDKRIDQYQSLESVSDSDKLLIISKEGDKTVTRTADKRIFLQNISTANLIISQFTTPESSDDLYIEAGKLWFDENYIYVSVDTNKVKRIPLQTF